MHMCERALKRRNDRIMTSSPYNRGQMNSILCLFTHPDIGANLYGFLSYVEHKRIHFEGCARRSFPFKK